MGGFFTTIGSLTASKWDTTGLFAFATAEEEQRWLCTAQLHQLMLWQLVWGEAANLRHAPEMIACVFHCAANAVKLPPQTPPLRPGSTALYLLPGSTMPYPPSDFLDSVVRPVYLFLRREVLERREEPVGERVMYDDVNEFFWYKDRLRLLVSDDLLRDPQRLHEAYSHMRLTLSSETLNGDKGSGDTGSGGSGGDGGSGSGSGDGRAGGLADVPQEGAATRLSRLFQKSFCERTTWLNVVHIFYRIYLLHSLLLHLSVVLAFVGWEPTHLASVSLTHAAWKTLRQLVEMRVGHSPRGADSVTVGGGASVGGNRLQTSHAVHICAYLTTPSVLAAEWLWRKAYSTTRPMYVFRLVALVYLGSHAAAHVLLLRPGRVLRSFLRREASPYVGAQQQLAVPTLTSACYTAFWLTTLALKFTFGHFFLIVPLVEPLSVLWNYQDQCWASTEFCAPKVAGSVDMAGERKVRQMVFTLLLMALRAVVPLLVYFFDTFIW